MAGLLEGALDLAGDLTFLYGDSLEGFFSSYIQGACTYLAVPIFAGDFLGVFSRLFDLPYLSSLFMSTSTSSSDFGANPKMVGLYSL